MLPLGNVGVHPLRKGEGSISGTWVLSQQSQEANAVGFAPSMDAVSLFSLFSAGVKFQVLEQQDGKPLRLLMQVSHMCPPRRFLLRFPPHLALRLFSLGEQF